MIGASVHRLSTINTQPVEIIRRAIRLEESQQILKGTALGFISGVIITKLCTVGTASLLAGGMLGGIILGGNLAIWHATHAIGLRLGMEQVDVMILSASLMHIHYTVVLIISVSAAILNPLSHALIALSTQIASFYPLLVIIGRELDENPLQFPEYTYAQLVSLDNSRVVSAEEIRRIACAPVAFEYVKEANQYLYDREIYEKEDIEAMYGEPYQACLRLVIYNLIKRSSKSGNDFFNELEPDDHETLINRLIGKVEADQKEEVSSPKVSKINKAYQVISAIALRFEKDMLNSSKTQSNLNWSQAFEVNSTPKTDS